MSDSRMLRAALLCAALLSAASVLAAPAKEAAAAQYSAVVDGPAVRIAGKQPGQVINVAFTTKRGQDVRVAVSNLSFKPTSASTLVGTVRDQRGQAIRSDRLQCVRSGVTPQRWCRGGIAIPEDGKYTVEIEPPFSAAPSFDLALVSSIVGTLSPDRELTGRIARAGQDARFELDVPQGADFIVEVRDPGANAVRSTAFNVFAPDGRLVGRRVATIDGPAFLILPETPGKYSIVLEPTDGETADYSVIAKSIPVLAIDGPPLHFESRQPGDMLRYRIPLQKGKSVILSMDDVAFAANPTTPPFFRLRTPQGGMIGMGMCGDGSFMPGQPPRSCKLVAAAVAEPGRYTVEITAPQSTNVSGGISATMMKTVAAEPGKPIAIANATDPVRYVFRVSGNQSVTAQLTKVTTTPRPMSVSMTLVGPQGYPVGSAMNVPGQDITVKPFGPAGGGEYAVVVDPRGSTMTGELSLITSEAK